jgi:hypothetical protein
MENPVIDTKYRQLHLDCKDEKYGITTYWNCEGKESGISFTDIYGDEINYLHKLLQSFKVMYLKNI